MSNVKIKANASGTADFTIEAPATDSAVTMTLPADAGTILTDASSLPAANLTGTLPAIDGSALTGIAGGGKVLQVVQTVRDTDAEVQISSSSFVTTDLSASITPSSTSSKILVIAGFDIDSNASGRQLDFTLYRGGSNIGNSRGFGAHWSDNSRMVSYHTLVYLDSPSTTSSTTYTVYGKSVYSNSVTIHHGALTSTMTLIEVGA